MSRNPAKLTQAITELLEFGPSNGFTNREIASMVRSLGSAKITEKGCYTYGSRDHYSDFGFDNGKRTTLHRAIHQALHGPVPSSLVVRHTCDVKSCIRPSHLISGTPSQNARDAYERNRMDTVLHPKGSESHASVLCESDVLEIRRRLREHESVRSIHADYPNVSLETVRRAAQGRSWTHVAGEVAPLTPRSTRGRSRLDRATLEPKVREMYDRGDSLRDISSHLGLNLSTVLRWKASWRNAEEQAS